MQSGVWSYQDIVEKLKARPADEEQYVEPFRHGSMRLGMYAPRDKDLQSPHKQDELYIVAAGEGQFVHDGKSTVFKKGDALFVAAGVEHRFENFSEDFYAWVVFWGKEGGEENQT